MWDDYRLGYIIHVSTHEFIVFFNIIILYNNLLYYIGIYSLHSLKFKFINIYYKYVGIMLYTRILYEFDRIQR